MVSANDLTVVVGNVNEAANVLKAGRPCPLPGLGLRIPVLFRLRETFYERDRAGSWG